MSSSGGAFVTEHFETESLKTEIFCAKISPDNLYCACGCGDGTVKVFAVSNGQMVYSLDLTPAKGPALPITCIRFRPTGGSKAKNVVLVASPNGTVEHWHMSSSKRMSCIEEKGNQIFALDYHPSGTTFASCGSDHKIRIYDEATKELINTMEGGSGTDTAGHSNRIFSLKYHPHLDNVLLTAGWDNTIQIWDTRMDYSIRSIYGPHVCGDALDMHDETILTGSWRAEEQLQMWDFGTGELIDTFKYPTGAGGECSLYAAQFNKEGTLIAAGGSGSTEGRIFNRETHECVGTIYGFEEAIYTLDFSNDGRFLAFGGADGILSVQEVTGSWD